MVRLERFRRFVSEITDTRLPKPDLPVGPYVVSIHAGGAPPMPPFTSGSIERVEESVSEADGMVQVGARIPFEPRFRYLYPTPDRTTASWPKRIFELTDFEGLRHVPMNARGWQLEWDTALVAREVPAHLYFGPYGAAVPSMLEQIKTLSEAQIMRLRVDPSPEPRRIPGGPFVDPPDAAKRGVQHARPRHDVARGTRVGAG